MFRRGVAPMLLRLQQCRVGRPRLARLHSPNGLAFALVVSPFIALPAHRLPPPAAALIAKRAVAEKRPVTVVIHPDSVPVCVRVGVWVCV